MPFRGESSGVIFDSILNRVPDPPSRLNPDLPAELEHIITKCLEKDRNLRYQRASECRADLQRLGRDLKRGNDALVKPSISQTNSSGTSFVFLNSMEEREVPIVRFRIFFDRPLSPGRLEEFIVALNFSVLQHQGRGRSA